MRVKTCCYLMRQINAIAHANNICIFCFPPKQFITHKSANNIAGHLQCCRCMRNFFKNKQFPLRAVDLHSGKNKKNRRLSEGIRFKAMV